jgi:hypothetical protein
MARPTLSTARKKSAKAVANKLAKKAPKSPSVPTSPTPSAPTPSSPSVRTYPLPASNQHCFSSTVPGLVGITPDAVVGMMPKFDQSAYQIIDPLNPLNRYLKLPKLTRSPIKQSMQVLFVR